MLGELTIDPARLWPGEAVPDLPLVLIDLDAVRQSPDAIALPPVPVIGLGDPEHPLAGQLDAVIEAPVTAEGLAREVIASPHAAAVTVQLLRLLPSLGIEDALAAESLVYAVLQGSAEHARWRALHEKGVPAGAGRLRVDRDDARLVLTLDRPAAGNAIDRPMRDALYEALALAALDPEILAVELHGGGRAFSLGADLDEFGTTADPATAHAIRARTLPARMAACCADRLEVHVQGACVGAGLELAAWGRRVIAAPNAWFQLPELAMGVLPGAGGCVSLSRRIGRQRTALMILSGKRLNARQALGWGLVDEIA